MADAWLSQSPAVKAHDCLLHPPAVRRHCGQRKSIGSLRRRLAPLAFLLLAPLLWGMGASGETGSGRSAVEKIVPPQPGLRVCYRKLYDADHLAEHPLQSVTEMIFYLRVYGMDAAGAPLLKNPDHLAYQFGLSLRRRGEKRFRTTAGDCTGDKIAECYVDCDGGGVAIENRPENRGLRVLLHGEGIAFGNDCDTTRGSFVAPGADDKIFDLEPAPLSECAYLERRMGP